MFSFQKFLVLVGVLSTVWAVFRLVGQLQKAQQERERLAKKEAQKTGQKKKASAPKVMDLSACPKCGDFVPGGKHEC